MTRTMRLLVACLTLPIAIPLAVSAQEGGVRVSERLRHKNRLAAVALPASVVAAEFTVAPSAARSFRPEGRPLRARVRLAESAPTPVPPSPLPAPTLDLLGEALGGGGLGGAGSRDFQNPGPPVLDHIELSARTPWVNEKGNVEFFLPYDVDPDVPSVNFNKNFPGLFYVNLKLEEGKSYLVDVAVSSWGAGAYKVEVNGSEQEFADPQGNLEHLLIALQATESGWVKIDIIREGTGYYMYSVTADRVN
jgi:hypothetical protein